MTKIARFEHQGSTHYGVLEADDALRIIDGDVFGDYALCDKTLPLQSVRLLAPVSPPNVIAIGLNYRAHAIESEMPLPERPVIFLKATTSVCGPRDPIVLPRVAPNEVDYECEMAIVIGKTAKHVSEDAALDYVLGYTCSNDVTQRRCQLELDAQWARGKSFDTFAPIGPWIETDIADPDDLAIRTRLNGQIMQESNTNDLIFSCRQLISHISDAMTMPAGTVIMTGTPSGVGFARKPAVFLKPGDVVEIEVEGIGTLRNPVVSED